jgi:hypothetical protein
MSETPEREYHVANIPLRPGHRLIGLVSLAYDAEGCLHAVMHAVDGIPLPRRRTPWALRALADELEVESFREELDVAP